MTRLETRLGETPQRPLGDERTAGGSFGAAVPRIRAGKIGFVLQPALYKRPCCKTCKGEACIGRCKF